MDKLAEIQTFKEKTWVDYFKAMERYFIELGTNLVCLDEDELNDMDEDIFKQWLDKLYKLCSTTEQVRTVKAVSEHYKELHKTFIKCISKNKKMSRHDILYMELLDKDKTIDVLCKNNRLAYNPFLMMNDWAPAEFDSVLLVDLNLANSTWYIKNIFLWRNLYKQKIIKKAYQVAEYKPIPKKYIKKVFWNLYTPYVWWLIQTEQFSKLIIDWNDLMKMAK